MLLHCSMTLTDISASKDLLRDSMEPVNILQGIPMIKETINASKTPNFHKDEVRTLGRELELPAELLECHPFPSPSLSIRIIYAEELFMETDFGETQVLIRLMVDYANMTAKNMPCTMGLKSGRWKKIVFFWKNYPVATSMLPRYCLFALSVFSPDANRLDPSSPGSRFESTHSIMPVISHFATIPFSGFYDWTSCNS
ncbi:hypothetical protein OUZ56_008369 [Daphnia magna]|uniref:GMP synthase n=1 Tax=Daphnia magna TaxID=35525 RepID=A0ABR0ACR0_9CRUS|nr:hypothetical protein OUZ56_008369 [Daphnia magna]